MLRAFEMKQKNVKCATRIIVEKKKWFAFHVSIETKKKKVNGKKKWLQQIMFLHLLKT